jgi:rhodanese-related sulfurtransferase
MHSTETFYVENIKCGECSKSIREALLKMTGVHEVEIYVEQGKVCVMGIGLNRFSVAEKLVSMGYPEQGSNSFSKKAKSLFSCLLGEGKLRADLKKLKMKKNIPLIFHVPAFQFIDVRTAEEFNTGHIPGAINMDVKEENFRENIKALDASKIYLLYCRTGRRSETALQIMIDNGFQNVRHFKGGIESWNGPKE